MAGSCYQTSARYLTSSVLLRDRDCFCIIQVIDSYPEKALTKDAVPVDTDAVLFWKIVDPQKAALDVAGYQSAIS